MNYSNACLAQIFYVATATLFSQVGLCPKALNL